MLYDFLRQFLVSIQFTFSEYNMIMNWQLFCQELGQRLRTVRKKAGLTQEHLAKVIGITRRYIIQIEQGKAENVSFNIILDFLNICNVQWSVFFDELEKALDKKDFDAVINETGLKNATNLTLEQKRKIDRDISYYRMRVNTRKGKAKPLSEKVHHQASVKFGKYRMKIEPIEAEIQKKLGELNVPTIYNQAYKDFAREFYKLVRNEYKPRMTTDMKKANISVNISDYSDKLNQIIEKWLKQELERDILQAVGEIVIRYYKQY